MKSSLFRRKQLRDVFFFIGGWVANKGGGAAHGAEKFFVKCRWECKCRRFLSHRRGAELKFAKCCTVFSRRISAGKRAVPNYQTRNGIRAYNVEAKRTKKIEYTCAFSHPSVVGVCGTSDLTRRQRHIPGALRAACRVVSLSDPLTYTSPVGRALNAILSALFA